MLLRNIPFKNARPRNNRETQRYVDALAMKRRVDSFAEVMANNNQESRDLDPSKDGVVLDRAYINIDTLSNSQVRGALSLGRDADGQAETDFMNIKIVPNSESNRTYSFEKQGDKLHYTRQFEGKDTVTHLVHDLATDRLNMFVRDEQGRFIDRG